MAAQFEFDLEWYQRYNILLLWSIMLLLMADGDIAVVAACILTELTRGLIRYLEHSTAFGNDLLCSVEQLLIIGVGPELLLAILHATNPGGLATMTEPSDGSEQVGVRYRVTRKMCATLETARERGTYHLHHPLRALYDRLSGAGYRYWCSVTNSQLLSIPKLPPEHDPKDKRQALDPKQQYPRLPGQYHLLLSTEPLFPYLAKLFWIIGNDPVQPLANTPPHHAFIIDRPSQDGALMGFGIA